MKVAKKQLKRHEYDRCGCFYVKLVKLKKINFGANNK